MARGTGRTGLIFDIDGTLLDTNYLHVIAWSDAFHAHGFDRINMCEIHRCIGLPGGELVRRLTGEDRPDLPEIHGDNFTRLRDRYGVSATDGAADLLRGAHDHGWTITLATSGAKADLDWMLDTIGARDVIAGATASADVAAGKPSPDIMLRTIQEHGLDAEHTVAVGDSVWDMRSATEAGIPGIGLASGGISAAELADAGAREVHHDPRALLDAPESMLRTGVRGD